MTSRYLFLLTSIIAASGAEWDQKAFPDWSDKAVMRLLTGCGWTKPKTVQFNWRKQERRFDYRTIPGADHNKDISVGSPVGGIGAPKSSLPDKAAILLRWSFALPVRQAKALYQMRDEKLPPAKLNELIGVPETNFVLELFGLPAEIAYKGVESIEVLLMQSAVLRTTTGKTIKPLKVVVTTTGLQLKILIHFPKSSNLNLADKELNFSADMQLFMLKETFKLSEMVYQGSLEL